MRRGPENSFGVGQRVSGLATPIVLHRPVRVLFRMPFRVPCTAYRLSIPVIFPPRFIKHIFNEYITKKKRSRYKKGITKGRSRDSPGRQWVSSTWFHSGLILFFLIDFQNL